MGLGLDASLRRWRWLPLHLRQFWADASPARRTRRPDRHRRIREIRIVECADAHEDQMRPRFRLAEKRGPTRRTESPMHLVAAGRDAWIIAGIAMHHECRRAKAGVDRSAAGTDILAVPAPAHARDNRRCRALPTNCSTKASACDRHGCSRTGREPLTADPTSERTVQANHIPRKECPCPIPTSCVASLPS